MCVQPSVGLGQPALCSSPNNPSLPASNLTPSHTDSSANSTSPNNSNNEDGGLLIDEGDEHEDDHSIEDILKERVLLIH